MVHYMKGFSQMDIHMDSEEALHQEERFIKVNLSLIKWMEKDSSNIQMEGCMKENGKQAKRVVKVNFTGQMDKFMKANLRIMSVTVMVFCTIQMERNQKVFGEMERSMEKQYTFGQIMLVTMFTILMERSKVKECLKVRMLAQIS